MGLGYRISEGQAVKNDRTTTTLPAVGVPHGECKAVSAAVDGTLRRLNGGLPPNLHMAPRPQLLKVIRELHDENKRLRAQEVRR